MPRPARRLLVMNGMRLWTLALRLLTSVALSADTRSVEADVPANFYGKLEQVCVSDGCDPFTADSGRFNGEVIHG